MPAGASHSGGVTDLSPGLSAATPRDWVRPWGHPIGCKLEPLPGFVWRRLDRRCRVEVTRRVLNRPIIHANLQLGPGKPHSTSSGGPVLRPLPKPLAPETALFERVSERG